MNAEWKNGKDYVDCVRDAEALRGKYVSDFMSNGWRWMKEFIRSHRRRVSDIPRLTRTWQE
jgi:hypothetical protein